MRAILIVAVLGLAACYTAAPQPTYAARVDDRWSQAQQATLSDGHEVLVQRDATSGELIIVQPYEMQGTVVALVNDDPARPMVKVLDAEDLARLRHNHRLGSGGDVW